MPPKLMVWSLIPQPILHSRELKDQISNNNHNFSGTKVQKFTGHEPVIIWSLEKSFTVEKNNDSMNKVKIETHNLNNMLRHTTSLPDICFGSNFRNCAMKS